MIFHNKCLLCAEAMDKNTTQGYGQKVNQQYDFG